MKKSLLKEYKADFLLLTVAISWGVTFLMVQDAIKDVPVYSFLFYRFLIATLLMFMISYKRLKDINFKNIIYGTILGVALFAGFATQTFALNHSLSSIVEENTPEEFFANPKSQRAQNFLKEILTH